MNTELLDSPEIRDMMQALLPRVSVADYERMGEMGVIAKRTELIRGIIIKKMPKSPQHAFLTKRLYDLMMSSVPSGCIVRQDQPLKFSDSMPEPDVAVVSGQEEEFWAAHPQTAELVIEVAVTTLALDRANALLYAENGVREYWIVIEKQRAVEVYREPRDGLYQRKSVHAAGDRICCGQHPELALSVGDLFSLAKS